MAVEGTVIRGHGKSFIVRCQDRELFCEIRGKLKFIARATTPVAVGDNVTVTLNPDGTGIIESVAERATMFCRPAKGLIGKRQILAANLDQLAVVGSTANPALKTGLLDRFIIAAEMGNLKPIVIINKIDLERPAILIDLERGYRAINVPIFFVSAKTGEGCDNLLDILKNHNTLLGGHSGVGKSALLNRLIPGLNIRTGEISVSTDRGIHTTTHIELFALPQGGYVADSPGLKVMGFIEIDKERLDSYYPEMHPYLEKCRFAGCAHMEEPGCAVKEAVEKGEIPEFRYQSYLSIRQSL
ncbi:putative ribosome biogenesis GTPase RsgA [Candidatus Zixiibacteriota bacterium]|nr:putative ribosome biogenesis GTPase RsgA [candidate division Zixibacteria bacterium]